MVRRFAVIGSPIEHSLSPVMHLAAYRALGIEDAQYGRYEVREGELRAFVVSPAGAQLDGLSVTMPGKPEARALASERDAMSGLLGVSNTLLRRPDGGWRAENHDVHGIAAALRDHGAGSPQTVGILGSGATSLSAVAAAERLGASRILLTARSEERAAEAAGLAERLGMGVVMIDWARSEEVLGADAVISGLALGGASALARAWSDRLLPERLPVVLDALYDPAPPPLTALLRERGGEVAGGMEMLVHQADMQLRSMVGVSEAPREAMMAAALDELARRSARDGGEGMPEGSESGA